MTVNSEGDVHISDDTVEGLGKIRFPRNLFGALSGILRPLSRPTQIAPMAAPASGEAINGTKAAIESKPVSFPWDPGDEHLEKRPIYEPTVISEDQHERRRPSLLTELLPDPGYFVAGGIAGVVSRTATAPLDRLKVFLIAQVGVKDDAVKAVKSGAPVRAAETAARPLIEACKTLWRMGGIQGLFAGEQDLESQNVHANIEGNGLNVVKVMPESAIKFGSYEVSVS